MSGGSKWSQMDSTKRGMLLGVWFFACVRMFVSFLGMDGTEAERPAKRAAVICFHCNEVGHYKDKCPLLVKSASGRRTSWEKQRR